MGFPTTWLNSPLFSPLQNITQAKGPTPAPTPAPAPAPNEGWFQGFVPANVGDSGGSPIAPIYSYGQTSLTASPVTDPNAIASLASGQTPFIGSPDYWYNAQNGLAQDPTAAQTDVTLAQTAGTYAQLNLENGLLPQIAVTVGS
jgi:hypothetical protein